MNGLTRATRVFPSSALSPWGKAAVMPARRGRRRTEENCILGARAGMFYLLEELMELNMVWEWEGWRLGVW